MWNLAADIIVIFDSDVGFGHRVGMDHRMLRRRRIDLGGGRPSICG